MKEKYFWILNFFLLCGLLATEVYNCSWKEDGTYSCDKISEDRVEESIVEPPVFEDYSLDDLPTGSQWNR